MSSCQSDSDLLMNLKGVQRYGQCTRYLAELKIGQKVTVSIKPSVMKVRPSSGLVIVMKFADISIVISSFPPKIRSPLSWQD